MIDLSKIFLGHADGSTEAATKPDFDAFFFDYDDMVSRVSSPLTYLVLGKKGSGKSLLGAYLHKSVITAGGKSTLRSLGTFQFQHLEVLGTNDPSPHQYAAFWRWSLLLELAKLVLQNASLRTEDSYRRLRRFMEGFEDRMLLSEYSSGDLARLSQVEGNKLQLTPTKPNGPYYRFIPDLENVLVELLGRSPGCSYMLILDELDQRFENRRGYRDGLVSLIKAAQEVNTRLFRDRLKAKVLVLLRTDIFGLLNGPDLNKVRMDNTFTINWGSKADRSSPLLDVIVKKAQASTGLALSREIMLNKLFPPHLVSGGGEQTLTTEQFLLSRTFLRPRDVIQYLRMVQQAHPEATCFTIPLLQSVEVQYSRYLWEEIRNELKGHVEPEDIIEEMRLLLTQFGKYRFTYDELREFQERRSYLKNIELDEALRLMFNFGIIGNARRLSPDTRSHGSDYRYTFKYRDESAEVNPDNEFIMHYGLRKFFIK